MLHAHALSDAWRSVCISCLLFFCDIALRAGGLGAMPAKKKARTRVEEVLGPRSERVRRVRPRLDQQHEDHDDDGYKSDDSVDAERQLGV